MILTGKCREDFLRQFGKYEYEIDEMYLHRLILYFLDSSSIYLSVVKTNYMCRIYIEDNIKNYHQEDFDFENRELAIKEGIILCNNIYNEKYT